MQQPTRATIEPESKLLRLGRNAAKVPHQQNRRAFLTSTVAAVGLVAASLIGFGQFIRSSEAIVPKTIHTEMASDFATLDVAYATLGRSKIEAYVATNNQTIKIRTLGWVQERGHIGMYDLICDGLSDSNLSVVIASLDILETINPVDLKSFQNEITTNMQLTQNESIKADIVALLRVVESS